MINFIVCGLEDTLLTQDNENISEETIELIKNIQNVGGNLAGVILNRIPISNKKYEEKYYYYGNEKVLDKNKKASKMNSISKKQEKINKQKIMKALNIDDMNKYKENKLQEKSVETEPEKENDDRNEHNVGNLNNNEEYFQKTNDILNQIKDYLDNEKKDLD